MNIKPETECITSINTPLFDVSTRKSRNGGKKTKQIENPVIICKTSTQTLLFDNSIRNLHKKSGVYISEKGHVKWVELPSTHPSLTCPFETLLYEKKNRRNI